MNQSGDINRECLKKARNKALRCLTYRQRSKKELRDYLTGKGFSEEIVEQVVQRLQDTGLINDRNFTAEWIECSFRKGRGSHRIKYELKERGIDEAVIDELLEESFDQHDEYNRACSLMDKYLSPDYKPDDKKLLRKAASYLKRRGYPHKIIYEVINKYFE